MGKEEERERKRRKRKQTKKEGARASTRARARAGDIMQIILTFQLEASPTMVEVSLEVYAIGHGLCRVRNIGKEMTCYTPSRCLEL